MRQVAGIIILLISAVFYFILPYDLIPDSFRIFGRLDDFIFLFIVVYLFFFKPLVDEIIAKNFNKKSTNNSENNERNSDFYNINEKNAYKILGVSENASLKEIKNAYVNLIKLYHPDLVENLGEEIREVAATKTKQINEAYEKILVINKFKTK